MKRLCRKKMTSLPRIPTSIHRAPPIHALEDDEVAWHRIVFQSYLVPESAAFIFKNGLCGIAVTKREVTWDAPLFHIPPIELDLEKEFDRSDVTLSTFKQFNRHNRLCSECGFFFFSSYSGPNALCCTCQSLCIFYRPKRLRRRYGRIKYLRSNQTGP